MDNSNLSEFTQEEIVAYTNAILVPHFAGFALDTFDRFEIGELRDERFHGYLFCHALFSSLYFSLTQRDLVINHIQQIAADGEFHVPTDDRVGQLLEETIIPIEEANFHLCKALDFDVERRPIHSGEAYLEMLSIQFARDVHVYRLGRHQEVVCPYFVYEIGTDLSKLIDPVALIALNTSLTDARNSLSRALQSMTLPQASIQF